MTHTIDCKRAIAPARTARVRTGAPWAIGDSDAVVGSRASRDFALRNGNAAIGNEQMRCRAFPAGGVP